MTPRLPIRLDLHAIVYRQDVHLPLAVWWTTLPDLVACAGLPLRATVPDRRICVYVGTAQIRTSDSDIVGIPDLPLGQAEAALRALEALAYSFHHHGARACVYGRGIFYAPPSMPAVADPMPARTG